MGLVMDVISAYIRDNCHPKQKEDADVSPGSPVSNVNDSVMINDGVVIVPRYVNAALEVAIRPMALVAAHQVTK